MTDEDKALLEFVLFDSDPNVWQRLGKKHKILKHLVDFVHTRARTCAKLLYS